MKRILLVMFFVFASLLSLERLSKTQTKPETTQSEDDKNRPKLVALMSGKPDELTYDRERPGF
jgi:hypothetical protein